MEPSAPSAQWAYEVQTLRNRNAQLSSELQQVVEELNDLKSKVVSIENMPWLAPQQSPAVPQAPSSHQQQQQQHHQHEQQQQQLQQLHQQHQQQYHHHPQQPQAAAILVAVPPQHAFSISPHYPHYNVMNNYPVVTRNDSAGTSISAPISPQSSAVAALPATNDRSSESSEKSLGSDIHSPLLAVAKAIQKKPIHPKHLNKPLHASPALKKSIFAPVSHRKTALVHSSANAANAANAPTLSLALDAAHSRSKKEPRKQIPGQSRYWTTDEHKLFLEALKIYGHKDLRAISSFVGTRNMTQVRTHTQKYFMKLMREAKRRQESEGQVGDSMGPMSPVISAASTPALSPDLLDLDKDHRHEDVRSVPETCGVSLLSMVAQATR